MSAASRSLSPRKSHTPHTSPSTSTAQKTLSGPAIHVLTTYTVSEKVNSSPMPISTLRPRSKSVPFSYLPQRYEMLTIHPAKALDNFGVDYIELTNPASSPESRADCEKICALGRSFSALSWHTQANILQGLKSKILTHIRCHMDDARIACAIPGLTG